MFILTILGKAWALLAPWLGGALLTVLPWFAPLGGVLKAWRPVLMGLALVAVFAAGWWVARPVERLTVEEAKQVCEEANLRARLDATEQALRQAELTLQIRGRALRLLERQIEALREEREALRAAAPDPTAIVFDADDPWLRTGSTR